MCCFCLPFISRELTLYYIWVRWYAFFWYFGPSLTGFLRTFFYNVFIDFCISHLFIVNELFLCCIYFLFSFCILWDNKVYLLFEFSFNIYLHLKYYLTAFLCMRVVIYLILSIANINRMFLWHLCKNNKDFIFLEWIIQKIIFQN